MEREAQHGTRLRPFDPTEHEGETAQAFEKFLRLFRCKYMAWDRSPPTSEANPATWIGKDMLKQLRGHIARDRFMDDVEAVATEDELESMTIDSLVERLRERYQPTQNETMSHNKFHRLRQNIDQSFDSFVNDVKSQAKIVHSNVQVMNVLYHTR